MDGLKHRLRDCSAAKLFFVELPAEQPSLIKGSDFRKHMHFLWHRQPSFEILVLHFLSAAQSHSFGTKFELVQYYAEEIKKIRI